MKMRLISEHPFAIREILDRAARRAVRRAAWSRFLRVPIQCACLLLAFTLAGLTLTVVLRAVVDLLAR